MNVTADIFTTTMVAPARATASKASLSGGAVTMSSSPATASSTTSPWLSVKVIVKSSGIRAILRSGAAARTAGRGVRSDSSHAFGMRLVRRVGTNRSPVVVNVSSTPKTWRTRSTNGLVPAMRNRRPRSAAKRRDSAMSMSTPADPMNTSFDKSRLMSPSAAATSLAKTASTAPTAAESSSPVSSNVGSNGVTQRSTRKSHSDTLPPTGVRTDVTVRPAGLKAGHTVTGYERRRVSPEGGQPVRGSSASTVDGPLEVCHPSFTPLGRLTDFMI